MRYERLVFVGGGLLFGERLRRGEVWEGSLTRALSSGPDEKDRDDRNTRGITIS